MSQPDQIGVEPQTEAESNYQDSTMEDVGTIAETPRTMSLAPSDSQEPSEESTRASTPTDNRAEDVSAQMNSSKHVEQEHVADDITMRDVYPEMNSAAGTADEHPNPKVVSWPSSTVIDPGSSPWRVGTTKEEPADPASDPQKLEELFRISDSESHDLVKP